MAATLETPVDEFSGLPLPIVPTKNLEQPTWHHHFHPERSPILGATIGGMALRNARMQLVDETLHNIGPSSYHDFYLGPPIPEAEKEQFRLSVLACAGYIPDKGIDFSDGEPIIRAFEKEELENLRTVVGSKSPPYQTFRYQTIQHRHKPIYDFFTGFLLDQDLAHVDKLTIEEFLTTQDETTKRHLGHLLLSEATKVASEYVNAQYREARKIGQLHPFAPNKPHVLIRNKLGKPFERESIFPRLSEKLGGAALQTEVNEVELAA